MATSGTLLGIGLCAAMAISLTQASCAKVVFDDSSLTCLHFSDPDRSVPQGPPPSDRMCAVEPGLAARLSKSPNPPGVTPTGQWTRDLVCMGVDDKGQCPTAEAAAASFTSCLDTSLGDGCDHPLGGECKKQTVWSACGPDPNAIGGCCYEVLVAESDVYS